MTNPTINRIAEVYYENAFDLIEKMNDDDEVSYDWNRNLDSGYGVFANVPTSRSFLICMVARDEGTRKWNITAPEGLCDGDFSTRQGATVRAWKELNLIWKKKARKGELDTEKAIAYRDNCNAEKFNYLIESLERSAEGAEKELANFKKDLDANPLHAFEWGMNALQAAAIVQVTNEALDFLRNAEGDPPTRIAALRDRVTQYVIDGARSPSRSTSDMHNLADQERLSARAKLLDDMRWHLTF
jgi:hypothetical protein